jgi:hypothetical protein
MEKIKITSKVSGGESQEHEIEPVGGFTVVVHQQGIRVDVPNFVEVNSRNTIDCVQQLNATNWEWISTGDPFRIMYHLAMKDTDIPEPPKTIEELKESDFGVQHLCGLLILGSEAMMAGKNVFFRNPENFLHPKVERCFMMSFKAMLRLFGRRGEVKKVGGDTSDGPSDSWFEESLRETYKKLKTTDPTEDVEAEKAEQQVTLQWLNLVAKQKGMYAPFAKIGEDTLTLHNVIRNVEEMTSVGRQVVRRYLDAFKPKDENASNYEPRQD